MVEGKTEQLSQLRLLVLKQLGALLSDTSPSQALSFYCQAVDLGGRDVVLFNRVASLVSRSWNRIPDMPVMMVGQ